jgi:S-adenosylmethionine synthetase
VVFRGTQLRKERKKSMSKQLYTSESVRAGHPDKLCDFISNSILDGYLTQDPESKVACEVMATRGTIIISGEITSSKSLNIGYIVYSSLKMLGYNERDYRITEYSTTQSPEIANAVNGGKTIGAGDQGTVYGYATKETNEFLPLPLVLSHRICERLDFLMREKIVEGLLPDGKAQVTVEYEDGVPKRVKTIVVSAQHEESISEELMKRIVKEKVLPGCFLGFMYDNDTEILVNPSGKFVLGGPEADTGLTGRKIIVDTYGGFVPHGGGAFSGKDPTKVDRSGAYMARYIAKNIVAAKLADKCMVSLSYAIGVAEPVAVDINTFGATDDVELKKKVWKIFDLTPGGIIKQLDLLKPIYSKTSAYGHFGREGFTWENTDKAIQLINLN